VEKDLSRSSKTHALVVFVKLVTDSLAEHAKVETVSNQEQRKATLIALAQQESTVSFQKLRVIRTVLTTSVVVSGNAKALNQVVEENEMAKKRGLYDNINRRKRLGISRSKKKSTITKKAYDRMKRGFKKKKS
jgi:hypothetical protein